MGERAKKVAGVLVLLLLAAAVVSLGIRKNLNRNDEQKLIILAEPSDGVIVERDVSYSISGKKNNVMDIAYQADGKLKPLLVVVHGGSWTSGDKLDMQSYLYTLSSYGYTVANIEYEKLNLVRLNDENIISIAAEEKFIGMAVKYLCNHADEYQIDTDKVFVLGYSAGGQLVGHLAERISDNPENFPEFNLRGVILLAPASDFRYYLYNSVPLGSLNISLVTFSVIFDGKSGTDVITEIDKVDVLANVTENLPPVLIVQGTADVSVPLKMSQKLYEKMLDKNVDARLTVIDGADHNLGVNAETYSATIDFMNEVLQAG